MLPTIFGMNEGMQVSKIFNGNRCLMNEQGGVIELIVDLFSWGEVIWIMRVEALLNDSPKVS